MFSATGIPFWIPFDQNIPKNALKGGREGNQALFIGRAPHSGSLTPGKILADDRTCIIPWGTLANIKSEFEILVCCDECQGESKWVATKSGNVPINAFPSGHSEQGETLYIGRASHNGSLIVGKIQPSHRVFYFAFEGQELNTEIFEVLVV